LAGGHPRETMEASFDIIHDGMGGKMHQVEAEIFHVACQVMGILNAHRIKSASSETLNSYWYIRLNHTRLADTVLDLCDVGPNESLRRMCFHILSRFTAPAPHTLLVHSTDTVSLLPKQPLYDQLCMLENLKLLLQDAVLTHRMSSAAASRFSEFVELCMPLPANARSAIGVLQQALVKLKRSDNDTAIDVKREKRLEDAAKSLRSIKNLILTLDDIMVTPVYMGGKNDCNHQPLYISIDLGLNQRRKNYHGGLIFQCIALPDDYFQKVDLSEHNESIISPSGKGTKIAEGGNYSDLVRKHRPPGNFMSTIETNYSVSRIPLCVGVRFSIGNIVELIYRAAALSSQNATAETTRNSSSDVTTWSGAEKYSIELLRRSLGHPLHFTPHIRVIVASVHGMDDASIPERFFIASRLWNAGIAAEYLPQSGVALSLINRLNKDSDDLSGSSDWSLMELQGVCALLRIPFIAIVQPHLLKGKDSVRLRKVKFDHLPPHGQNNIVTGNMNTGNYSEMIVSLDELPSVILEPSPSWDNDDIKIKSRSDVNIDYNGVGNPRENRSSIRAVSVECFFIDNDQLLSSKREVRKNETPNYKNTLRSMKSVQYAAESFLSSLPDPVYHAEIGLEGVPVFAVTELSFFILREIGTEIMRRERTEWSTSGACTVMMERHPKHKRVLRTLSIAIDNFMKQSHNFWNDVGDSNGASSQSTGFTSTTASCVASFSSSLITILLYSIVDDRFDMITLSTQKPKAGQRNGNMFSSATTKRR
jgi:hypothetical protein